MPSVKSAGYSKSTAEQNARFRVNYDHRLSRWSYTYALFAMTSAQRAGDSNAVMYYMVQFYFESATMNLALITVGKMLESLSKGKTTNILKSLLSLAPKTVTLIRENQEV